MQIDASLDPLSSASGMAATAIDDDDACRRNESVVPSHDCMIEDMRIRKFAPKSNTTMRVGAGPGTRSGAGSFQRRGEACLTISFRPCCPHPPSARCR
jgi:hypothetical protein